MQGSFSLYTSEFLLKLMSYAFKFIKNDIKEIMNSSETTSNKTDQVQSICDMEDKLEKIMQNAEKNVRETVQRGMEHTSQRFNL